MGNASSGGTANVTTGMSSNSSGQVSGPLVVRIGNYLRIFSQGSGAFSVDNTYAANVRPQGVAGQSSDASYTTLKMNISHTHNVYLRGSVSLGNGDSETRPVNYTIRIWKRIS